MNEMIEMQDKGVRDYFTLAGWVNYWDLAISGIWLGLMAVRILFIFESLDPSPILSETYTFFWAFQAFSLTFRSLVLFRTSEYFGLLIRMMQRLIIQMYVESSVRVVTLSLWRCLFRARFMFVLMLILIGFAFGLFFIRGSQHVDYDYAEYDEVPWYAELRYLYDLCSPLMRLSSCI